MITIGEYLKPQSLEECLTLNRKKANRIIGGMGWLKMSKNHIAAAIDLSSLSLDKITETDEEFIIGAMVSLRCFETHDSLNCYFNNAPKEAVRHIVGVQFRNCATIGGSLWLRPGFSDPITLLLALNTTVELYDGDNKTVLIPLSEFCAMKKDNCILTSVHIKKDSRKVVYTSFRNTETDFPVLTAAVSKSETGYTAVIGARPYLAQAVTADTLDGLIEQAKNLKYNGNIRATAEYRKMLSAVLIKNAFNKISD